MKIKLPHKGGRLSVPAVKVRKNEIPLVHPKADLALGFWVDLDTLLLMPIKKGIFSLLCWTENAAASHKFSLCTQQHGEKYPMHCCSQWPNYQKCYFRGELDFQCYFQFLGLTRLSFQLILGAVLVSTWETFLPSSPDFSGEWNLPRVHLFLL